ncbi:Hypothetical protein CAP_1005 [Chondromyces apiculatus DSM 436]|uniref:Uncharacterized protein n=1 Tax=Chondromyces apiculatus DSM 436 TaxID=1192034 RepID=A0A017SVE0_9BACT|nr:Hypothetical protein CAP_1005 [Chondromyces apiculatus DSM 436]
MKLAGFTLELDAPFIPGGLEPSLDLIEESSDRSDSLLPASFPFGSPAGVLAFLLLLPK